jgi:predicted unusual protein kinase regulating ubiquinone biosynthesis (AarF/ABC1/UbiB family)
MRALSTFEGVGRSLDSGFSLVSIARPYLLPLMTSSGAGSGVGPGGGANDRFGGELFNEISRQAAAVSSRALGLPKRLDDSLARIEQGDLQVQIRAGETDRLLRRLALAQQSNGQSMLLAGLAVAAAVLVASNRPAFSAAPLMAALPVGLSWLKLQARLKRDGRLDQLPGVG